MSITRATFFLTALYSSLVLFSCEGQSQTAQRKVVTPGAHQLNSYLPKFKGKKIGLLVNQTSTIGQTHLIDTLLSHEAEIKVVFAPEHGFRGNKSNGAIIKDDVDAQTGLPIISLYGKNKKPSPEMLQGLDMVMYDIQDVGARFYTYISSMHYMMEACAENNIPMLVLDRPNPNGSYIDGPVLDLKFQSFVGMHPIPIVYGMTPGEVAQMIVGEGWLDTDKILDLSIVEVKNWDHSMPYALPIIPSPNLPNDQAIALYPGLCLFEGTNVSVGRGTDFPFQVIGFPDSTQGNFSFTPKSIPGVSKYPKHENMVCYGIDLRSATSPKKLNLDYLIKFYNQSPDKSIFFNDFFVKLAGTDKLKSQIESGLSESEIRKTWQEDLARFKAIRDKYVLYKD